jgi:hypothetical protein
VSDDETAADSDRASSYSLNGTRSNNDGSGDGDNHHSDSGGPGNGLATAPTMIVLVTKRGMLTVVIPVMALVQVEVVLKCRRLQ